MDRDVQLLNHADAESAVARPRAAHSRAEQENQTLTPVHKARAQEASAGPVMNPWQTARQPELNYHE